MRQSISAFFACAIMLCASAAAVVDRACTRAVAFVLDLFDTRPALDFTGGYDSPHGGPVLAYAGPPLHELRHEAGTSRRSAARHT